MDVRSWRKILLQWITECNFIEHNYFNIEQTNIDAFFRNFCLKHKVASEFVNLRLFLETHYPEFRPNVDDENALSAAEYIYVYSLLLHFCCVKFPDEYFHGICQKLTEQAQLSIAAFFKHLLECSNIDKEHLRQAIAEVAATYMSPPSAPQSKNESMSSSGSSAGAISAELQTSFSSSPLRVNGDSPLRTPNRKVVTVVQRVSPSTPKSFLLEERTRELYNFKAQLETERYEKGLLELQIMQNEQQIYALNQVQKKLQQQIQNLKDEILNQSVEPNRNQEDEEQLQRRLYRQINEREDEIFRLNERIRIIGEERALLENKMRHAEKKVIDYRETVQELEIKLNELATELEKKESTIKCLTDDKVELEHFIAESRTASSNSRPDFNFSNDCLDSSLTRYTNSSGSLGSPENLGVSVVDVQLREKEHENAQLREELSEIHTNNKKLANYIKEKTLLYKKEYNLEISDRDLTQDDDWIDPATDFLSYVDCMNHLSQSYKDAKGLIRKLEDDIYTLQANNNDLKACIKDSEQDVNHLKENLSVAEDKNAKYMQEIENLEKLKNELAGNYEATIKDFETKLKDSSMEYDKLKNYIDALNEKIRLKMSKIESLDELCISLQKEKQELKSQCAELSKQLQHFELTTQSLQDDITHQNHKLQSHMEAELLLKQRNEQLLIHNEELMRKSRETKAHLDSMYADIKTKETELGKLGKEIVQLGKTNAELEERIEKLMHNLEQEKNMRDIEIKELQESHCHTVKKLKKKCLELEGIQSDMEVICREIESLHLLLRNEAEPNECNPIKLLTEIKEVVGNLLEDQKDHKAKVNELNTDKKQSNEKIQLLEGKLNEEIKNNEQLLKNQTDIDKLKKELFEAQKKIVQLESLVNEMEENHQGMISNERKRAEESRKIVQELQTKLESLVRSQDEERIIWKNKEEQLLAEVEGEKEIRLEKESELALQVTKLTNIKHELYNNELQLKELQKINEKMHNDFLEQNQAFEAKVTFLSEENVNLKNKLSDKAGELESKTNELLLCAQKYEETLNQLKAVEHEFEESKKHIENIQICDTEKIKVLEEKISSADLENADLKTKKDELESALKEENEMLLTKVYQLETLTQEYNKAVQTMKSIELEVNELQTQLSVEQSRYGTTKANLEQKIKELVNENENLKEERKLVERELKAKTDSYEKQQMESECFKQELTAVKNRLQIVQEDFVHQKLNLEENLKILSRDNQKYIANIHELKTELVNKETLLKKADDDIKKLMLQLENATAMVNERNLKLQESRDMLSATSERLEEKTDNWKSLQMICEKQSEELVNLRELHQKQSLELEILQSTTQQRSEEFQTALSEIDNLKKDNQCKIERTKDLETQIGKLQTDLEQAESKYEEIKKLYDECSNELDKSSKEKEHKTELLEKAEQSNYELNALIKVKDQHIEELNGLLKETETCLQSVNDECTKLQSEIVAKEAEVRMVSEELKQAQEKLTSELNTYERTKNHFEKTFADLTNLLEKTLITCNIKDVNIEHEISSNEKDCSSILDLKHVVKKIIFGMNHQKEMLQSISDLQSSVDELNKKQAIAATSSEALKLQLQSAQQTIEDLKDKKLLLEKQLSREHTDFQIKLNNLEQLNEKLNQENATLQLKLSNKEADLKTTQISCGMLKTFNERLSKAQDSLEAEYSKTMKSLESEQLRLKETLNEKDLVFENLQKELDNLNRCATEKEAALQQKLKTYESDVKQINEEKAKLSRELATKEEECTTLTNKCQDLEFANTELNTQSSELQKEIIKLRADLTTLNEKYDCLNEHLTSSTHQLDEANSKCNSYREKVAELNTNCQQLERHIAEMKSELQTSASEVDSLLQEKENLCLEKQKLSNELNATKRECQDFKQTMHNLNQKLALGDLEKDDLRRQLELLRTQVEVNSRYQTTSESKLKNIVETSQALERNLLSSENALKTMRTTLEQSKLNADKLSSENIRLRDSVEALNKRIEKMALKLGESQARASKLERENEKLIKSSEAHNTTIEALQRDKDVTQLECKTLKERLNRIERLHEQNLARVQSVEKSNASLNTAKQKLEATEIDLKSKISKLESLRQVSEERLRKMTYNYERCERENVNLNHQIGALNTEIQILKNAANDERNSKLAEMNKSLSEAQALADNLKEHNKKLTDENCDLRQQNLCLTDQLSKAVLALEISKARCDQLEIEVQQLETEVKKLHQDKISTEQFQNDALEAKAKYKDLYEKELLEKHELEQKILCHNNEIAAKEAEISELRKEVDELRQNVVENSASLKDKATNLVAEVENLRTRLNASAVMLEKEQENNAKLRADNQILLAKYREAKQRIETEVSASEERIKENRLELEGKLEKMKNKMKILYTEEVTKMKAKQERETAAMRSELSILKAQNAKYEEHTRKLSTELMTLNDRMLEYQKENAYLLTKLKHTQNEDIQFKRPNSTNTNTHSHTSSSTIPRISSAQSVSTNIGTDLAMEDEEGEIFNNTYLTDMKNGRMTEIAPEELQHRNSLLPPHLKSAYAIQYDHGLCEDEVKDNPSNGLDDSMSALLSNNTSCIRKKIIGVTHYRKPGPPTPSKNGGRLSFGGNSEPTREILKESYDDNIQSSAKTPARFGFFSSRFSMGNSHTIRDEHGEEKQDQTKKHNYQRQERQQNEVHRTKNGNHDLLRALQKKNMEKISQTCSIEHVPSVTKICTSTPRKSRGRTVDKRRLIHEILKSSSEIGENSISSHEVTPPEMSVIETPTLKCGRKRQHSATSAVLNDKKCRRSSFFSKTKTISTNSSIGAAIAALQRRIHRRPRRQLGSRPSLCVQKNLYTSKVRTPQRCTLRDLKRIMGRRERMMCFDKHRMLVDTSSSTVDMSDIDFEDPTENGKTCGKTITVSKNATFALKADNCYEKMVVVKDEDHTTEESGSKEDELNFEEHSQRINVTDLTTCNDATNFSSNDGELSQRRDVVTSKELNAFEDQLEHLQSEICTDNDHSSVRFEELLKETASEAPFKIRSIRFSSLGATHSDSGTTTTTTSSSTGQNSDQNLNGQSFASSTAIVAASHQSSESSVSKMRLTTVAATPHQSKISPSSMLLHSRTIYGASVIFNRRIPNIDGLRVRKSSIYFKNPKCSTFRSSCGLSAIDSNGSNTGGLSQEGDLILVTNQTITLYDLICMWHQMNVWTRITIVIILLGSMSAIGTLLCIICFGL